MNCHSEAAERGWDFFGSSEPPPSLEEVNQWLGTEGLDPVSPRMYKHYRRLAAHDLKVYLPINELDVRLKLGRVKAS